MRNSFSPCKLALKNSSCLFQVLISDFAAFIIRSSSLFKRYNNIGIFLVLIAVFSFTDLNAQPSKPGKKVAWYFQIPQEYLREAENIPSYWVSSYDDVTDFLIKNVHKGKVEIIGTSAGGRPIRAVFYGKPREGKGTTTFSGSLGFGDVRAYRGPDHDKTVYMGMAAVHGGEFEGIVGMVNLISVIETGKDLRGRNGQVSRQLFQKLTG